MGERLERFKFYGRKGLTCGALFLAGGAAHSEAEQGLFGPGIQRVARAGIMESTQYAVSAVLDGFNFTGRQLNNGINYVVRQNKGGK